MQGIISVSKLSKTYASGLRALKDIDLEIRRGEIFALLGPNGAGKTTLIGTICGIFNPSAGSVRVDGKDIKTLTIDTRHGPEQVPSGTRKAPSMSRVPRACSGDM